MKHVLFVVALVAVALLGEALAEAVARAWEYQVVTKKEAYSRVGGIPRVPQAVEHSYLEAGLNKLGREGWELVGQVDGYLVFKRPAVDEGRRW